MDSAFRDYVQNDVHKMTSSMSPSLFVELSEAHH